MGVQERGGGGGGVKWSRYERNTFYYDPLNRLCIPGSVNASKSDRALDEWTRFTDDEWLIEKGVVTPCLLRREMAEITVAVKRKYNLPLSDSERSIIGAVFLEECELPESDEEVEEEEEDGGQVETSEPFTHTHAVSKSVCRRTRVDGGCDRRYNPIRVTINVQSTHSHPAGTAPHDKHD